MIKYQDNPDLGFKTVKTIGNKIEYRKNCRKIREKYYIIEEDCFKINDIWYLKGSKNITFDYELKKHVILKESKLVYGIVEIQTSGTPVFGYFTENKYNNVLISVPNYGSVYAYNEELLKDNGYAENMSDGIWFLKSGVSSVALAKAAQITARKVYTNKGYNIEDNDTEFKQKIDLYEKYPVKINAKAATYGKFLGETSFGCEIETSQGYLPEHIQARTGVVICRDGSIDNAEFVTVPLRGAKGLLNLKTLSKHLSERCNTDLKCSFHIHLGTIPTDRLFIVALYALGIRIQDEVYKMFPYYKTEWEGVKKQDYNQKIRKLGTALLNPKSTKAEFVQYIDEAYYRIYTFLNDGVAPSDSFNRTNHRHQQSQKWNRKTRYYWLNFLNLFFSPRMTAEFRLHHQTLNGQKMVNWLFICNAIVRYAEQNAKKILTGETIKLNDVLGYYENTFKNEEGKFLSDYLKAYYKDRKKYFEDDYKAGDKVSQKEMKEDKKYVFEYQGVSWLF